jgi:hypothetical protein
MLLVAMLIIEFLTPNPTNTDFGTDFMNDSSSHYDLNDKTHKYSSTDILSGTIRLILLITALNASPRKKTFYLQKFVN